MKAKYPLAALSSGLISGGLFLLIFGFGMGAPLMLIPTIPLLMTGLNAGFRPQLLATIVGMLSIIPFAGVEGGLFHVVLIGVPCLLFAPLALTHERGEWLSVGRILTDITVYAGLVMLAVIAFYARSGGMEASILATMGEALKGTEPELQTAIDSLVKHWGFLILGASVWWWVLLLYAHGWLSHAFLKSRHQTPRLSLILEPFNVPLWMLGLLTLAGAFTFAGDPEIAFAARTLFVIFLLPYFLLGISIAHLKAKSWPARGVLLFLIYFFTLSQAWPALVIAGVGIWHQVKALKTAGIRD